MSTLTLTIIQEDLHWHDVASNLEQFARVIDGIGDLPDLVVLPEMFTTGFSMAAPDLAETMDGRSVTWMKETAKAGGAAICGSLIIRERDKYYNRFICAMPDGTLVTYDKRHLFRLADEQAHYAAGDEIVTFELNGFRICPLVCYDLRFPVWSRNRGHYDLLIYVANWPSRRHHAWRTLLRARAIENLSYCAGVNRVGRDGNDIPYAGGSAVLDYLGEDMADLGEARGTATVTLEHAALMKFRDRFAFHRDADAFTLDTPG